MTEEQVLLVTLSLTTVASAYFLYSSGSQSLQVSVIWRCLIVLFSLRLQCIPVILKPWGFIYQEKHLVKGKTKVMRGRGPKHQDCMYLMYGLGQVS